MEEKKSKKEKKQKKSGHKKLKSSGQLLPATHNFKLALSELPESFFEEMIKTKEHINNEEEIKQTQIRINGELIPFSYFHQFKRKGNYTIKYSFKHYLTKTNSMFNNCDYFTKIDLSNFNAEKVNIAHCMFSCKSLKYLDLSCFNNKNADFRGIVGGCTSLKYENVITNNNFLLKYVKSSLNPF